jgi:hypothetical protein
MHEQAIDQRHPLNSYCDRDGVVKAFVLEHESLTLSDFVDELAPTVVKTIGI